jgi:hypothetical protein
MRHQFASILVLTLVAFVALGTSTAFAQHEDHSGHDKMEMKGEQQVTLVGEVLDLYCYMKHPADGQGAEHAKCAQNCIRKGLPIGFISDGVVYVIIGKEHNSAADMMVDYAGMQSRLTGTLIEHDGVKAIEIEKIEKVSS